MSNLQHDSYAALNLLATHPGIDSSRIGCTGWSLGGGAAVYNALDAIGNRLGGPFGVRFASHLGFLITELAHNSIFMQQIVSVLLANF